MPKHIGKEDGMDAVAALTPEQWAFLIQFSANYVAGRKALCWVARAVVGIGMIGGAIAGIVEGLQALMSMRGH